MIAVFNVVSTRSQSASVVYHFYFDFVFCVLNVCSYLSHPAAHPPIHPRVNVCCRVCIKVILKMMQTYWTLFMGQLNWKCLLNCFVRVCFCACVCVCVWRRRWLRGLSYEYMAMRWHRIVYTIDQMSSRTEKVKGCFLCVNIGVGEQVKHEKDRKQPKVNVYERVSSHFVWFMAYQRASESKREKEPSEQSEGAYSLQ